MLEFSKSIATPAALGLASLAGIAQAEGHSDIHITFVPGLTTDAFYIL